MKKLQNDTLQQFIDNLIEELKNENDNRLYHKEKELNIPFIISSLYQSFKNDNQNTYKDFISDLKMYPHYDISFNEPIDDLYGIIDADISFSYNLNTDQDIPYYSYRICFSYDERLYGYCECTLICRIIEKTKDAVDMAAMLHFANLHYTKSRLSQMMSGMETNMIIGTLKTNSI